MYLPSINIFHKKIILYYNLGFRRGSSSDGERHVWVNRLPNPFVTCLVPRLVPLGDSRASWQQGLVGVLRTLGLTLEGDGRTHAHPLSLISGHEVSTLLYDVLQQLPSSKSLRPRVMYLPILDWQLQSCEPK